HAERRMRCGVRSLLGQESAVRGLAELHRLVGKAEPPRRVRRIGQIISGECAGVGRRHAGVTFPGTPPVTAAERRTCLSQFGGRLIAFVTHPRQCRTSRAASSIVWTASAPAVLGTLLAWPHARRS